MDNGLQITFLLKKIAFSENMIYFLTMINQAFVINLSLEFNLHIFHIFNLRIMSFSENLITPSTLLLWPPPPAPHPPTERTYSVYAPYITLTNGGKTGCTKP